MLASSIANKRLERMRQRQDEDKWRKATAAAEAARNEAAVAVGEEFLGDAVLELRLITARPDCAVSVKDMEKGEGEVVWKVLNLLHTYTTNNISINGVQPHIVVQTIISRWKVMSEQGFWD